MINTKIWGYEDIIVDSQCSGKKLFIKEQYRSSLHKHKQKNETLIVGAEGLVYLETGSQEDDLTGVWLTENNRVNIPPGIWHRITAMRDSVLYEFSNVHPKEDIVRNENGGKIGDDEFRSVLSSYFAHNSTARILEVGEAELIADHAKKSRRIIGMCNGCFDLVHLGHMELLMQAKQRCEILFVAVNDDNSIAGLKGPKRPFINEIGRMGMIASCRYVDYVIAGREKDCIKIVEAIKPDVYITTTEYGASSGEALATKKHGGKVEVVEMLEGYKTTNIASVVNSKK